MARWKIATILVVVFIYCQLTMPSLINQFPSIPELLR